MFFEIFKEEIALYLKLNPESVKLEEGFTRNMKNIGHYGTGDVEVQIKSKEDLDRAKELLQRAYNEN